MTIWKPRGLARGVPIYRAIADALGDDVASGRLAIGHRLPTHRELADVLGVTVGTVTRAYREAESRGLVRGEVGRGTYVRGDEPSASPEPRRLRASDRDGIDLGTSHLRVPDHEHQLARTLAALAADGTAAELLSSYAPQPGALAHREAGVALLARDGVASSADRVLLCNGAQHALAVVLMGLCRPGDALLVDTTTYPALLVLARALHLVVHPVACDDEGMGVDALAAACKAHRPRAIYVMPSLHNPTSSVMSAARRRELVDVADRHRVAIVEDTVHTFLLADPPRAMGSGYARGYAVASCSKSVAPGLRVGFLALPEPDERFVDVLWSTSLMAPPLSAELVTRWITDGTADRMIDERRREIAARQAVAAELMAGAAVRTHPSSLNLWLELPSHWSAGAFTAAALQRGVSVVAGDAFMCTPSAPPAVRVSLGSARDRDELARGLAVIRALERGSSRTCVV